MDNIFMDQGLGTAALKDIQTTSATVEDEMMNFVMILIYMGIAELSSIHHYWAMGSRSPHLRNVMPSLCLRRFRLIKEDNDNTQNTRH